MAPAANEKLLGGGVLDRFRERLAHPQTLVFVALDDLLDQIEAIVAEKGAELRGWSRGLVERYRAI